MTIILEGSFLRASFEEPPGSDSAGQNVRQPGMRRMIMKPLNVLLLWKMKPILLAIFMSYVKSLG